jgi:hypothetical protein
MSTTFWLAFAAYVLPTFPLGYFWHLKTFAPIYDSLEMFRPNPVIPMGLSSMILQGLFIAWAYPQLFPPGWSGAFKFFITFGLFAWSFAVLPVAAKYRMRDMMTFVRLETAFTAVQFAVTAVLLGLIFRA